MLPPLLPPRKEEDSPQIYAPKVGKLRSASKGTKNEYPEAVHRMNERYVLNEYYGMIPTKPQSPAKFSPPTKERQATGTKKRKRSTSCKAVVKIVKKEIISSKETLSSRCLPEKGKAWGKCEAVALEMR